MHGKKASFAITTLIILGVYSTASAQEWVELADVPESLTYPVVTVLDGRIHVMGGGGSSGATDAHYRYDPATDTWDTLAPVPYLAQQPAGTAVAGRIHYFGGGYPNSGSPLADHFVYDPATDSWDSAALLNPARAIHYAVNLNDTLYSLAGQSDKLLCQKYNPGTDSWTTLNNLPDLNFWYGAHLAANGMIYRFGGGSYISPVNSAHEYNPVSDTWTALPSMPTGVHGISGSALDGIVYLVGGYYSGDPTDEVWTYDIANQTYDSFVPLPVARTYHRVVTAGTCIYSVGGNNAISPVDVSLLRICPYDTVDTVTGIRHPPLLHEYKVYCSGGILRLVLPGSSEGIVHMQVIDLSGREVSFFSSHVTEGRTDMSFDVSHLTPGVYLSRMRTSNISVVTKVFIDGSR